LLGVLPYEQILRNPSMELIQEELGAQLLNPTANLGMLVNDVVVGAMSAQNAIKFFKAGTLLITPGDREDIVLAACASLELHESAKMAGVVLTGGLRPSENILKIIRSISTPFMLAKDDSYEVASKVNNLIVKTRPGDAEKISLIRDIVAKHVNVKRIIEAL
jgi:BioD-like phosphotransacetylase family protein